MGVGGLTTFIARHADQYLENFELHDTYLVIDGNSIACQLYNWYSKCNCAFGGDYDVYARCVENLFDELLMCNVTPLVLLDGGYEDKKIKTCLKRIRDKIIAASAYTPSRQRSRKFFPLFLSEVFNDIMQEKGIQYAQCLFEADDNIAAVARVLGCPVLSFDSDFYVYDVLYIPFDTLHHNVVKSSTNNGYVKRCKLYKAERLLATFNGLDRTMLPLAATLLGNDYIKRCVFRDFLRHLKLSKSISKKTTVQQSRINAVFNWCKTHNLNSAITMILSRVPKYHRKRVLNAIENMVNSYTSISSHMLLHLGFTNEFVTEMVAKNLKKPFKYQEDIDNLMTDIAEEVSSLTVSSASSEDSESNDEDEDIEDVEDRQEEIEYNVKRSLLNIAPEWFVDEFSKVQFSSYFVDILYRQLYLCPPQIEDYAYPSSHEISLKIIRIIYTLLTSNACNKSLEYIVRGTTKKICYCKLEPVKQLWSCDVPTLHDLHKLPLNIRKGILGEALEISQEWPVNDLPMEWRLYILTLIYWAQQQNAPPKTRCHVYTLLFAMLFNIIDQKLGYYRSLKKFDKKFRKRIDSIIAEKKSVTCQTNNNPESTSLLEAYNNVTNEDCLLAASFFISNFKVDHKVLSMPKIFNITLVHVFAQFQSCLRHSMHLNALLDYPYARTKVAQVYNGTLLYNLYNNFVRRKDVPAYINLILQNSPSLRLVFNALLTTVSPIFDNFLENKVMGGKKRKNRIKQKNETMKHSQENIDNEIPGKSYQFYDANNHFSLLGDAI
ncbi:protein asteroid isoform X1 [Cephus cinctus]|uniref:Protein asteroid isoform X1 n=1 Tax=Cephus cinctus TaxID=211228 RepID=A0AAJ7CF31_CEPCN|nr:protein asteroid isoform X1 [Cephus cinctus]